MASKESKPDVNGGSRNEPSDCNAKDQGGNPGNLSPGESQIAGNLHGDDHAGDGADNDAPVQEHEKTLAKIFHKLKRLEVMDTFIAAILAVIAALQLWAMFSGNKTARISADAAKDAAIAAKDAVVSAEKGLQLAENTAKRQTRAYLGVDSAQIFPATVADHSDVRIIIKNYGQTPAKNIKSSWAVTVKKHPYEGSFEATSIDPRTTPSLATIWPQGEMNIERRFIMNQVMKEQLERGEYVVYALGKLSYEDEFGDPHSTEFRFEAGGAVGLHQAGAMVFSPEGNKSN